jgi:hypothetical protein
VCLINLKFENESHDKYSQLSYTRTKNNIVKSKEGVKLFFDVMKVEKDDSNTKPDHFLILNADSGFGRYFSIGDSMILTINNSTKLRLKPSMLGSSGKISRYTAGDFGKTIYLHSDEYETIKNASSMKFEIKGSSYSNMKEITGEFSDENLTNLRKI